jgi:glycine/serine hydroxymethyltransferase
MGRDEMQRIADLIDRALSATGPDALRAVRTEVRTLAEAFPLYPAAELTGSGARS